MVNKTVLGWYSLSHHCRNLSKSTCKLFNRGIQMCRTGQYLKVNIIQNIGTTSNVSYYTRMLFDCHLLSRLDLQSALMYDSLVVFSQGVREAGKMDTRGMFRGT